MEVLEGYVEDVVVVVLVVFEEVDWLCDLVCCLDDW